MTIRIKAPGDGDYTVALEAIFTDSLTGFFAPMPIFWKTFAERQHLIPDEAGNPPSAASVAGGSGGVSVNATGSGSKNKDVVYAPKLLQSSEPDFTPSARALKYQAKVLVDFIVGTDGIPSKLAVKHAAGLGLDEVAIVAVERYRFSPAMKNGEPVAVELNVEVNFQIF